MKKSTFGAPKPLPGEAGYKKEKASEVLEKETKDMELKLKMLQERMLNDAMMNKSMTKPESLNGNKWNSSREDKGSFTSYAKDLQEKYKKQTSNIPMSSILSGTIDPAIKATANARRANRQQNNDSNNNLVDFKNKNVEDWTTDDVSSWLDSILLSQHIDKFVSNAINGPILLDISLNDLDYMGITVLGHRKVLLKGIEDLRINKKVTIKLAAPSVTTSQSKSPDSSQSKIASTSKVNNSLRSHDTNDSNKVHWSHLEPISSNKIEGSGKLMINPADNDIFDEAAEQEAFRAAVMEWRSGNSGASSTSNTKIVIEREDQVQTKKQDSNMWHNPFAPPSNNNASFDDSGDEDSNIITNTASKSLLNGALDEETEHAAFVKAVDAWRNGSKVASNSSKVLSLADQISQQLDSDLSATSHKYNQQKEELLIAAAKRKDNITHSPDNKANYSKDEYPAISQCHFTDDISDDDDDFLYTSRSNVAEEKNTLNRPNTGTVTGVSLVESSILDSKDKYCDESSAYIVEEYSDDEK